MQAILSPEALKEVKVKGEYDPDSDYEWQYGNDFLPNLPRVLREFAESRLTSCQAGGDTRDEKYNVTAP